MSEKIAIAKIGRAVGLRGEQKLNLMSDFAEQFKKGALFLTKLGELQVEYFRAKDNVIKFASINSQEEAKRFTNQMLYSTIEATRDNCPLGEDEFFWFDIMGLGIYEDGELLGKIVDIQRLPTADYFIIQTHESLVESGLAKSFMIPYIDKFVERVDIDALTITVVGAKDILKAS